MSKLQKIFSDRIRELPRIILKDLVSKKLAEQDILMSSAAVDALVDHILEKNEENFVWKDDNDPSENKYIKLSFDAEDEKALEAKIERVLSSIPDTTQRIVNDSSREIFNLLKKRWPDVGDAQDLEIFEFNSRLMDRWGEGLDLLRMLLTSVREVGQNFDKKFRRSKSQKFQRRRFVLLRLHIRACQVTDEIITLMSNGFADGAMARWRTLHEIEVVAIIIEDGDEDLAQAFIDHNIVEVKKQNDELIRQNPANEGALLSARQYLEIEDNYRLAIDKYGLSFRYDYGWASTYINDKKPDFRKLQTAADKSDVFSYYKIANINIHAGSRSMFFRLSDMNQSMPISGRSNAGLLEPGQHTAFALVRITATLFGRPTDLDRIIEINTLVRLRDAIPIALRKADRKLRKDDSLACREQRQSKHTKKQRNISNK